MGEGEVDLRVSIRVVYIVFKISIGFLVSLQHLLRSDHCEVTLKRIWSSLVKEQ